jgi:hypothetical protein
MKKIVLILIAALVFCFSNQALADDGSNLLAQCNVAVDIMDGKKLTADVQGSVDAGNSMYCFGLLQGVIRLNKLYEVSLRKNALFCTPNSIITNGQAARIVVKYLKEHPEMLHEPDFAVTINAFINAFPCK